MGRCRSSSNSLKFRTPLFFSAVGSSSFLIYGNGVLLTSFHFHVCNVISKGSLSNVPNLVPFCTSLFTLRFCCGILDFHSLGSLWIWILKEPG
ncbi:hypothetical protein VNO80_25578 [Phaseolus coccineus]|uniref:Uncharacterized protein n=1 Tax=Phaseolus coccineus TaxID=3886 RepID=A0AAN9LZL3_PHACN